jgi:hypothetical protein
MYSRTLNFSNHANFETLFFHKKKKRKKERKQKKKKGKEKKRKKEKKREMKKEQKEPLSYDATRTTWP